MTPAEAMATLSGDMPLLLYTEGALDDVGHFELLEPLGVTFPPWHGEWVASPDCIAEINERAYWEARFLFGRAWPNDNRKSL